MATRKTVEIKIPLIGETVSIEGTPEQVDGRTMKLDLTRILRGKSMEGIFVISSKNLEAHPKKLNLLNFHIRRLIRKGTNYIEDSFDAKCKDVTLRIKPFLITRKKVSRSIRKAIRDRAKEIILDFCKERESAEVFSEVVASKIQKDLSVALKKIYPLAVCEIRVLERKKQN
ncbi:MAG: hypothetical protein V1886_03540 [archaeon]